MFYVQSPINRTCGPSQYIHQAFDKPVRITGGVVEWFERGTVERMSLMMDRRTDNVCLESGQIHNKTTIIPHIHPAFDRLSFICQVLVK